LDPQGWVLDDDITASSMLLNSTPRNLWGSGKYVQHNIYIFGTDEIQGNLLSQSLKLLITEKN
jgi:hypothetical protein